jgi:hypothetical protein
LCGRRPEINDNGMDVADILELPRSAHTALRRSARFAFLDADTPMNDVVPPPPLI